MDKRDMNFHQKLEDLRKTVGDKPKEEFTEQHKSHFLVIEMKVFEKNMQQLMTRGPSQAMPPEYGRPMNSTLVATIAKTERNKDLDRIILGRAPDNDIVIAHPSISKLHAFFRCSGSTGSVKLSDAGSRFGTTLNGIPVGMGANLLMQSGDTIVFARSVTASYFTPEDFFEYLKITNAIY